MPRFKIVSNDRSLSIVELISPDASSALHTMGHIHSEDADIFQHGKYAFSAHTSEGGFWTIFQRDARELAKGSIATG